MPAWKFILDKKIISTQDPFSNFCCASNHILVLHQQIELTHLLSPDSHTVGRVMTPEPVRVYFTFSHDFRNLLSCWSQHLSLYVRERLRITKSWRLNLVEHLKKGCSLFEVDTAQKRPIIPVPLSHLKCSATSASILWSVSSKLH